MQFLKIKIRKVWSQKVWSQLLAANGQKGKKKRKKGKNKRLHECNKKLLLVTDLLRSTILLHSLSLGSSTILIGTTYVQSIVATQSAVAGKNISAQNTWNKAELKTKPPGYMNCKWRRKRKKLWCLF